MAVDFPLICGFKISGIGYRRNRVILEMEDGKEIIFSADKKGNLLINNIPKKMYNVGDQ
jgi:tRNA(Phe) wybutosine-synthesizing methylase Tyw3